MDNKIDLKLPDGKVIVEQAGITGLEVAQSIGAGLARAALVVELDGELMDLSTPIQNGGDFRIITFSDDEGKHVFWHSTAHIMAEAVTELFPEVKVAIGPAIEEGFYYDFDRDKPFTPEDLEAIEKKMKELIDKNDSFKHEVIARDDALKKFKDSGEIYKVELIDDIPEDQSVKLYSCGNFTDLCRGPHIPDTSRVKAVKLLSVAGAYWRGSEKNKMLQRIYGISFPKKSMLKDYLKRLEDAKARDHRKLGKELDLFSINEDIGPGLVLWHPNGAVIREVIEDYWRKRHREEGYSPVYTPHVGRAKLWKTSGHIDFYDEGMYPPMAFEEGQDYFVRPMNCPFHIAIYKTDLRSYRDLPIKYCELGADYRYERSGVLQGLLRVRGFTMDDAHIFCTPEQMVDEVRKVYEFSLSVLSDFGFKEFGVYLSTRPEKSVGESERWDQATDALEKALKEVGLPYKIDEGGGAFYGPKIDVKVRDALGREWQTTTVQFDFNEPERFDITYIDANGDKARPYMVHRALLGSLERFFACLIEHYAGNLPMWLAPTQVIIIPVSQKIIDYGEKIHRSMLKAGFRSKLDNRPETMGYRIREAEKQKIPYMIIVGEKEAGENKISVRSHNDGDLGVMNVDEFIRRIEEEGLPPS